MKTPIRGPGCPPLLGLNLVLGSSRQRRKWEAVGAFTGGCCMMAVLKGPPPATCMGDTGGWLSPHHGPSFVQSPLNNPGPTWVYVQTLISCKGKLEHKTNKQGHIKREMGTWVFLLNGAPDLHTKAIIIHAHTHRWKGGPTTKSPTMLKERRASCVRVRVIVVTLLFNVRWPVTQWLWGNSSLIFISDRTGSISTLDSLDFARYSDDGNRESDERVAGKGNFVGGSAGRGEVRGRGNRKSITLWLGEVSVTIAMSMHVSGEQRVFAALYGSWPGIWKSDLAQVTGGHFLNHNIRIMWLNHMFFFSLGSLVIFFPPNQLNDVNVRVLFASTSRGLCHMSQCPLWRLEAELR